MFGHKPHERKPVLKANKEKRMLPGQKEVYNSKLGVKAQSGAAQRPSAQEMEMMDADQIMQFYQDGGEQPQQDYKYSQQERQESMQQAQQQDDDDELMQLQKEQERIEREIREQKQENEMYDQMIKDAQNKPSSQNYQDQQQQDYLDNKRKQENGLPPMSSNKNSQAQQQSGQQDQYDQNQQLYRQLQQKNQGNFQIGGDDNSQQFAGQPQRNLGRRDSGRQTTQQKTSQQILGSSNFADKYEAQFEAMRQKQQQQKYGRIPENGLIGNQNQQQEFSITGRKVNSQQSQQPQQQQQYSQQQQQPSYQYSQQQQQYQYQQPQQSQAQNSYTPVLQQNNSHGRQSQGKQQQADIFGGGYNYFLDKDNQKIDQHKYGTLKKVPQDYDRMKAYADQQENELNNIMEKKKQQQNSPTKLW